MDEITGFLKISTIANLKKIRWHLSGFYIFVKFRPHTHAKNTSATFDKMKRNSWNFICTRVSIAEHLSNKKSLIQWLGYLFGFDYAVRFSICNNKRQLNLITGKNWLGKLFIARIEVVFVCIQNCSERTYA